MADSSMPHNFNQGGITDSDYAKKSLMFMLVGLLCIFVVRIVIAGSEDSSVYGVTDALLSDTEGYLHISCALSGGVSRGIVYASTWVDTGSGGEWACANGTCDIGFAYDTFYNEGIGETWVGFSSHSATDGQAGYWSDEQMLATTCD